MTTFIFKMRGLISRLNYCTIWIAEFFIENDFTYAIGIDIARGGVLDTNYIAYNGSLNILAVLKT